MPEPAPTARAGAFPPGHPLENRAREAVYRREEGRLHSLLAQAQAAQRRRRKEAPGSPVLAAFPRGAFNEWVATLEHRLGRYIRID